MAHTTPQPLLTSIPSNPSHRPHYTPSQLQTYFTRISLPSTALNSPLLQDPTLATKLEHGLPFLQTLALHHLAAIPFENLALHYSAHKKISLNMEALYNKFVTRGLKYGRGGRCMENNGFFGTVLRSLGYQVRNCAGRVSRSMSPLEHVRREQGQTYDGWNHMLNLLLLNGEYWVVDVGMGSMGPNVVYKLEDGMEMESIPPRRIRLQKRAIQESYQAGEGAKMWCFDVCYKPSDSTPVYTPTYAFTELEFLPQDYEMMSYFTSTNPACFFTYTLVCTKMLLDPTATKVIGDVTMVNGTVRRNVGKEREVLKVCATEEERVDALREIFGVELTDEEREGLRGDLKLR